MQASGQEHASYFSNKGRYHRRRLEAQSLHVQPVCDEREDKRDETWNIAKQKSRLRHDSAGSYGVKNTA